RVPGRPVGRADELGGGAGDPAGSGEPEGVGGHPHLGGGARPGGTDVGATDLPAGRPLRPGLRQPDPAGVPQPRPDAPCPPPTPLNKSAPGGGESVSRLACTSPSAICSRAWRTEPDGRTAARLCCGSLS